MAQVDISNIINVSISTAPQGLTTKNVNVIAIFTKETPLFPINNYVIYKSPTPCANDFGINSTTYSMVNTIFSQNLNILAGGGYVVVFPMLQSITTPATAGTLTCQNLIASNFIDVSDGSFKIAVDGGTATAITGLDFSENKDLTSIAANIQTALTTANVEANVIANETSLIFTSNTTGASSSIAITSNATGTDLTTLNYFNIAQAISINGTALYTGQELLQNALIRTYDLIFYEAILTAYQLTEAEITASAPIVQTRPQMLFATSNKISSFTGIFKTIKDKGYTHTRCLYNGIGEELLFASGYASKLLSVNFEGSGTANNLNTKAIIGISPDTTINDSILFNANQNGVDVYASVGDVGTILCSGKNEWSDTVLFLNWLKNSLEVAGFNALRNTPTKIAQTETGVQLLSNAYQNIIEQAVRLGYVAGGKWNLPFTFGDQELFYNNINQVGYYIYFEPVANQSQTARDNREAPLGQIGIKLAGAINSSSIIVYVNN